MRHFLLEFITGGGLAGQALSESLIREGELMIRTLLNELIEAGFSDISLTRDKRFKLSDHTASQHIINESLEEKLHECINESDIAWLIAPETNDCLGKLAEVFITNGKVFIGSSPDAIRIAASKLQTSSLLQEAGVDVVETKNINDEPPASQTGWVIKPDDGVGGESCFFIKDKSRLIEIIADKKCNNFVVQPFINGRHLSMSLLVFDEKVQLLACNVLYVAIENEVVRLSTIGVNECLYLKKEMMVLALKIIAEIEGFSGYIGVDMIEANNKLFVLEINPRFTTTYVGLSESLGINMTKKILDTFLMGKLPEIDLAAAVPVRIKI
tara:strand:- start:61767 stop:62744 length:978 start_codon:yes stop_codon:yes gene_type:complete